jgi:hypothetical protein
MSRRWGDIDSTDDFGQLDPDAIAAVRSEAWPEARNADELHEALMGLAFLTETEISSNAAWTVLLEELVAQRRATRVAFEPLSLRERGRGEGRGSDQRVAADLIVAEPECRGQDAEGPLRATFSRGEKEISLLQPSACRNSRCFPGSFA